MKLAIANGPFDKGHIKLADLQRRIAAAQFEAPNATPLDVANTLSAWFEEEDNASLRFDILHYAVSHMWSVVAAKANSRPYGSQHARKSIVAKAADKAAEQIVSTLKLMTFKQARMLHGATSKLDLSRGSDDQLLGDVFTDAEIRSAVA